MEQAALLLVAEISGDWNWLVAAIFSEMASAFSNFETLKLEFGSMLGGKV